MIRESRARLRISIAIRLRRCVRLVPARLESTSRSEIRWGSTMSTAEEPYSLGSTAAMKIEPRKHARKMARMRP